jgi:hypothetical protein
METAESPENFSWGFFCGLMERRFDRYFVTQIK